MLRTNRGLINELLWGRWCLFKALCYCMVTFKPVTTMWDANDTLIGVDVEGRVFYRYGKE